MPFSGSQTQHKIATPQSQFVLYLHTAMDHRLNSDPLRMDPHSNQIALLQDVDDGIYATDLALYQDRLIRAELVR